MIKVSELLSKQLICLDTASVAGTISNIDFDEKLTRGRMLELLSDDDDLPEVRYVELKKVSSLGGDAGIVKSADCILPQWTAATGPGAPNPINCLGFNQDGKSLGKVRDVLLEGTAVVKILLDETAFSPKELISFGSSLLIFNDTGKPFKLPRPKKMPAPGEIDGTVRIHTFGESASAKPDAFPLPGFDVRDPAASAPEKIELPAKIPQASTQVSRPPASGETGYRFLLGKPVRTAISSGDGRVLIPAGTLVTEGVIRTARENGKLVQLALRAY